MRGCGAPDKSPPTGDAFRLFLDVLPFLGHIYGLCTASFGLDSSHRPEHVQLNWNRLNPKEEKTKYYLVHAQDTICIIQSLHCRETLEFRAMSMIEQSFDVELERYEAQTFNLVAIKSQMILKRF